EVAAGVGRAMKLIFYRLILIVGMVGIIWVMPPRFEMITHERQEDIIGFCGHELVSTSKNEIRLRNIETLEMRKIDYPGAAWLYSVPRPLAGSCHLIPARHWLCANMASTGCSRMDVIDLSSGRFVKR